MDVRRSYKLVLLLIALLVSGIAVAETKICVKKRLRVKNGRIALKSAIKAVEDADCPARFVQVVTDIVGPKGDKGDPGDGFVNAVVTTETDTQSLSSFTNASTVTVSCGSGKVVLAGQCSEDSGDLTLQASGGLSADGSSWDCDYSNLTGSTVSATITARVYCSELL